MGNKQNTRKFLLIILFFLLIPGICLRSLETGFEAAVGSLNFDPDRTPADTDFSPYYLPVEFTVFASYPLDENMNLDITFSRDKILRNVLYGNFSFSRDYFSLKVGPFLGVGNTSETPIKSGLTASLEIRSPGSVFFRLRSGRSLNLLNIFQGEALSSSVSSKGDFIQEDNEVCLGLYMHNTIVSLFIQSKIFTKNTNTYGTVSDSQTDYGVRSEVFQKNIPFHITLSFFYRNLTRYFEETTPSSEHTIGSLIFGTRVEYFFNPSFSMHGELESSVYSFGLNDLVGEFAGTDYLFTVRMGFRYRWDFS
jgi:hypothetical protein